METAEQPAAEKPKRKKKPKTKFVAQRGGVDCGYGLRKELGTDLRFSRGVLVPIGTERRFAPFVHVFTTEKAMERAIRKTNRAAAILSGRLPEKADARTVAAITLAGMPESGNSMVDALPYLRPLLSGAKWGSRFFVQ